MSTLSGNGFLISSRRARRAWEATIEDWQPPQNEQREMGDVVGHSVGRSDRSSRVVVCGSDGRRGRGPASEQPTADTEKRQAAIVCVLIFLSLFIVL